MAGQNDYNIYIHSEIGSGNANPTKPFKPSDKKATTPKKQQEDDDFMDMARASLLTFEKAKGAVVRAAPLIASMALINVGLKVINTIMPFYTNATGDYRFQNDLQNAQIMVNACFNPIGTAINVAQENQRRLYADERRAISSSLLGESLTTNNTKGRDL